MGFEIRSVDEQDQTFASYASENRLWSEEKRMTFEFVVPFCRYAIIYAAIIRYYAFDFFLGKENLAQLLCILHRMFCMCHFRLWAEIFHCSEGEAQIFRWR